MPVAAARSSSDVPAYPLFQNDDAASVSACSGSYWRGRPRRRSGAGFDLFCTTSQKILDDRFNLCELVQKSSTRRKPMDLYFSPMACSLASRIALYEAHADTRFIEVDPKTKRTLHGEDYLNIYAL